MKNLLFLLLPLSAFSQISTSLDDVSYQKIIQFDGSKDELFNAARDWYVEAFQDSRSVIQLEDLEGGKILGRGYTHFVTKLDNFNNIMGAMGGVSTNHRTRLWFVVKTYFKDGKVRLVLSNTRIVRLSGNWVDSEAPLPDFYFKKDGRDKNRKC